MSFSETISPFLGRCVLVWFYLSAGQDILERWHHIAEIMGFKHVPVPPLVLLVVLILIFLGSVSLFFGWHARHGGVMLFALTVIAAVVMHDYWNMTDPAIRQAEFGTFARDIAIAAGLLMIVGMGPGPFAIDNRGGGKGRR